MMVAAGSVSPRFRRLSISSLAGIVIWKKNRMSYSSRRIEAFAALAIVSGLLGSLAPASAQEFFADRREFVLDKACDATSSIRSKADPTPLVAGTKVQGRGVNRRAGPTHVFVVVGNSSKWLELGCGQFSDGLDAMGSVAAGAKPAPGNRAQCLAFFDDEVNPVAIGHGGTIDITPKAPPLNDFDAALNAVCGAPGKVTTRDEFKALMRAHPGVLDRLRTFTGGKVFATRPTRTTAEDYLGDLADAWYEVKAFDHIFCGEPNPAATGGKIGGLHFRGRYLQLQRNGDACRMNNHAQNEAVDGVIYTMGVRMKNSSGRLVSDATKGYGLTLSGEDILKSVTRAFAENPTTSTGSVGCLLPIRDDGHEFKAVFVRRASGIRTFYPDATPNGRGDHINPDCAAKIDTGR